MAMEMEMELQDGSTSGGSSSDPGSGDNGVAAVAAYIHDELERHGQTVNAGGVASVIYRVPENLRASNPDAYKPKLVSVGPYHHGSPELQPMEADKCGSLRTLCELAGVTVAELVAELKDKVKEPRMYYRQGIDMDDDKLLAHLLIDGCFLFGYLGGLKGFKKPGAPPAPAPAPPVYSVASGLQHDVLLLENQVPFAVLEAIASALPPAKDGTAAVDVGELAKEFIRGEFQYVPGSVDELDRFEHLVDLCYHYLCPTSRRAYAAAAAEPEQSSSAASATPAVSTGDHQGITIPQTQDQAEPELREVRRLRRATEYRESGIHLKPRTTTTTKTTATQQQLVSVLDISFSRGELRIPRLVVDERTGRLLRNVVAYEQESFDSWGGHVTAYVLFMSQLMGRAEDVALLSEKGVVVHQLGSDEEVADVFRGAAKGVVFDFGDDYHLKDVTAALEEHRRDRRNRWAALLRHTYFSNPWLILGATVAMVAFVLSVTQAALNYFRFARELNQKRHG
ncbi:hypothetical protein ACP4OV_021783 [Aristida adscensionis]